MVTSRMGLIPEFRDDASPAHDFRNGLSLFGDMIHRRVRSPQPPAHRWLLLLEQVDDRGPCR